MTAPWLAYGSNAFAVSTATTIAATAFIIVACGYYEGTSLLVTQVALIGGHILIAFSVSAVASGNRTTLWWTTVAILALGWGASSATATAEDVA